jgi:TrpR family trp operon transcriptional repressor
MVTESELVSENIAEMSRALAGADASLIEDFLYSLLTPSEADEMAKRWALVKRIAEGIPQRDIAKELGLSLCKITRGSRELKKEDSSFKRMLERAGCVFPGERPQRRRPAHLMAAATKTGAKRGPAPRIEARHLLQREGSVQL